jgi:5-methyltetrahydropteroyltriglutamate--homocysteine methyltransferase
MARIHTTHTGSLPRPADLAGLLHRHDRGEEAPGLQERARASVAEIVRRQADLGLDLVNDGEQGKIAYSTYVRERLTGFEGDSEQPARLPQEFEDHPDFAERMASRRTAISTPACTGEVRVRDNDAARRDVANLTAAAEAAGVTPDRLFLTAASPGVIGMFFVNHHYPTREAFLAAVAEAMRDEYRAITDAGITLQLDCPDLAAGRHTLFSRMTLEEFRREAALNVEALNHAVQDIPAERLRLHVCWGNYDGPHDHDVPLRDIVDVILRAKPAGISLEAANPRHGHEWRVWDDVPLPDGRYLIPGVVESTNNFVEHAELVAERLLRYARVVGSERVVAGSDCGFATVAGMGAVVPSVAWSKLASLVEGARIASIELGR